MGIFDGYLLVSDMDGTLLNSKGKLSEENKRAIEYFVDNGGQFTLATGRMLPSIKRHIHKVKVTLRFRGREMAHMISSKHILDDFAEGLSDVAVVEKAPKVEGRSIGMVLAEKR